MTSQQVNYNGKTLTDTALEPIATTKTPLLKGLPSSITGSFHVLVLVLRGSIIGHDLPSISTMADSHFRLSLEHGE